MATPADLADGATRRYGAGDVLYREGEPGSGLHVLRSGSARVTRRIGDRSLALDVAGPGDVIGEDGLVGAHHLATATALEPTETFVLDAAILEELLAEDVTFAVRLTRTLMRKLDAAHERLALLARPSAGRLALTLARLAERIGLPDPDGTLIPRRLREIGVEVGLDEAALGEASTMLVRERLLRIKKNGIVVAEPSRMYDFVKASDAIEPSSEGAATVRTDGA
ncbi:MAG: Crp/Fnr family transcriptional regulator [Deltaproteobacteria bacterium]|nr:Crp/Fnr family transcriptional regulator [Deltaproteobacteria bacterium]